MALINFAAYEVYREGLAKDNDNVDSVQRAETGASVEALEVYTAG